MNRCNHSARLGFTLIEVISVVAILSVLIAILFPVFTRAKDSAYKTVAASNLRQLFVAVELYRTDYDGQGVIGRASAMGLPRYLTFYELSSPKKLFPGTDGLWASPCGQHPDTPQLSKAGTNLGYSPSDIEDEPWATYVALAGPNAVFLSDSNCNDKSVPIGSLFFTTFHIGVAIDGHIRRKSVSNGESGFMVWTSDYAE